MLAEMHCHSTYSTGKRILLEGLNTPQQMVACAKKKGIDIVAVTDHDTIRGGLEAAKYAKKYGIIVIPGAEITTRSGHVLALGIKKDILPSLSVEETIERIHAQGGIAIASHPFDVGNEGVGNLALKCDALEAFNAINLERISNWKARLFANKYKFPSVANSDAHCAEMIGYGRTEIYSSESIDDIFDAIQKGRTKMHAQYIPTKVVMEWSVKRLKVSYAFTLNYMNENYRWPKRAVCAKLLGLVKKSPGNIDYLFRLIAYFSLGNLFVYKAFREILMV
ncbi:MAG: PHP domain-containing protein [Candidatus Aenigmarchaeota archaeon]|nr:PHP domain-containing protein [Candidatus Aenigmarchaeota archaeon]